ncbi:MAG: 3-hydroxyacyl-ACP dehydratase FabZ [Rhodothalassiaceae bacterium]
MADLAQLDILQIMQKIPHRYPFLLIDRLVEINGDDRGVGIKNVTVNEPFFQGHFPGQPVFPGVLIIEAMAQTCAALVMSHLGPHSDGSLVYFMTIDKAKFRKPVSPGDRLALDVQKESQKRNVWKYGCTATVDGTKVAEAVISAMLMPKEG